MSGTYIRHLIDETALHNGWSHEDVWYNMNEDQSDWSDSYSEEYEYQPRVGRHSEQFELRPIEVHHHDLAPPPQMYRCHKNKRINWDTVWKVEHANHEYKEYLNRKNSRTLPPERHSHLIRNEIYSWDQYLNGPLLSEPHEYDSDNSSFDPDIQILADNRLYNCSIRDDFEEVFEEYVQSRIIQQNKDQSQSWWQWFKTKLFGGWT